MGDPVGRTPGPIGTPTAYDIVDFFPSVTKFLRDLKTVPVKEPEEPWAGKVPLLDTSTLAECKDLFDSSNWPDDDKDKGGNVRDPANARLPSARRERDARRPMPPLSVRIKDVQWSGDPKGSILDGEARGTVVIPTPFGEKFDSPTEIKLALNSAQLTAESFTIGGTARAYKVVSAKWNVKLKFDPRVLAKIAVQAAQKRKIGVETCKAALESMQVDFSSRIMLGVIPTWARFSASSLLPMRRPLYGALDRLLPVQLAALPDSKRWTAPLLVMPPGVAFNTPVPGIGMDYSNYGRTEGVSARMGIVTYPKLTEIGKVPADQLFPIFGHVDLRHVNRVSKSIDLEFRLTYSYAMSGGGASDPAGPQLEYLPGLRPMDFIGTKHQPWNPVHQENLPASDATSKHKLLFLIGGTF